MLNNIYQHKAFTQAQPIRTIYEQLQHQNSQLSQGLH